MEKFKTTIHMLFNSVYVPEELINRKSKIILHISDTPACFFYPLKKLIKKINPEYIIHTGDMVDDIKLEQNAYLLSEYKKNVKKLINILENSNTEKVFLALGNHDNEKIVKELSNRSTIIEGVKDIEIENLSIRIAHFPEEILKKPQEYNLFGHNIELKSQKENNKIYLNGIMSINIIVLGNENIFELSYPYGTDDARFKKIKIGL